MPIIFPTLGLLSWDNLTGTELHSQDQEKHFEADLLQYRSMKAALYACFSFILLKGE